MSLEDDPIAAESVTVSIRMPSVLRAWFQALAESDERTLSWQIVHELKVRKQQIESTANSEP